MSVIRIKAEDQVLNYLETPSIFSGDVNNDSVAFEFSKEWDGFTKTAIFYRSKADVYERPLDNNNTCLVPSEVMISKSIMYVGVIGIKEDTIITSEVLAYRIGDGAISECVKIVGPTPDIYEQILASYNYIITGQETYQKEWNERVDQSIREAIIAKNMCIDAIASMEVNIYDMDGGTPATDPLDYEYDINGGYPI